MLQPFYSLLDNLVLGMGTFVIVLIVSKVAFEVLKKKKKQSKSLAKNSTHSMGKNNYDSFSDQNLTLNLIREIEWKNFEDLCCKFFVERGFDARVTSIGADGGVDIELYKKGTSSLVMVVQCKSYKGNVGVKDIREFYGVLAASEVKRGVFITTSDFTHDAKAFAEGKAPKLQLSSGERFISLIKKLPNDAQDRLLKVAVHGNYRTPTCVNCNIKMVKRQGKSGSFFGCQNFPRCRVTMKVKV